MLNEDPFDSTFDPEDDRAEIVPDYEVHQDEAADTPPHHALDVQEIGAVPIDALAIFCRFLLPDRTAPTTPAFWRQAGMRLAALAHALRVDPVGTHSLSSLADAIGCSRASLSLYEINLRDFADLSANGGKSMAARQNYSERSKRAWKARRNMDGTTTAANQTDASGGGLIAH